MSSLEPLPLPKDTEESYIDCTDSCGLVFHIISAGQKDKPLILLTHGFPEIAYSWRKITHPHHAPPTPPFNVKASTEPIPNPGSTSTAKPDIQAELAKLDPPRKHYKWYNSTCSAANDWETPSQGLDKFLRGYWHLKSADWPGNAPSPLQSWTCSELGKMPKYYIMPKDSSMPDTVADMMKGEDDTVTTKWLSDSDLDVYVKEWQRIGFQGGLNWYRAQTSSSKAQKADMLLFAGKKIEVPCAFISGEKDWGNFQQPGALDGYKESCTDFRGSTFIPHAGH